MNDDISRWAFTLVLVAGWFALLFGALYLLMRAA
jgi:hypothetical protein